MNHAPLGPAGVLPRDLPFPLDFPTFPGDFDFVGAEPLPFPPPTLVGDSDLRGAESCAFSHEQALDAEINNRRADVRHC